MKTPTITIDAPGNKPLPDGSTMYGGFRFTVRLKSGGDPVVTEVSQRLVWQFSPWVEGSTYAVLLEVVDDKGVVVASLPELDIIVPSSVPPGQYPHPVGIGVAWA
jgi:hypothetical protein